MSTLPDEFTPEPKEHLAPEDQPVPKTAEDPGVRTGDDFSRACQASGPPTPAAPGPDSGTWETSEADPVVLEGHESSRAEAAGDDSGALIPDSPTPIDPLTFASREAPAAPCQPRIPHLGHFLILLLLIFFGFFCAAILSQIAIHYHLFGVKDSQDAVADIHYTLGTEAILYLIALAGAVFLFPLIWHRDFFVGVSWHPATARRLSPLLVGAAFVCFLLALINGWLMPGPQDAPIDKMFRVPGAAWLLFAFGVTFAPFFEELLFRGFLLPSLSTAIDWLPAFAASIRERRKLDLGTFSSANSRLRPLAPDGAPQWSIHAMIVASLLTSLPFAGMHAAQTGYAWGPFLLLICVSFVLCAVRLTTRSLAASVLVHACYNFMLFSLMLFGTGGFKHLENM